MLSLDGLTAVTVGQYWLSCGRRMRGARWQFGQKKLDRFMKLTRRTGVAQRGQGRPSRPYTARERSKYPLCPFTLT